MSIDVALESGRILIVGAGGHGKVVADAIVVSVTKANICFVDDAPSLHGLRLLDFDVLGNLNDVLMPKDVVHIAIGSNSVREKIYSKLNNACLKVIHPAACISRWSVLGAGSFVAANAVIGPDVVLGAGVIVNHGAMVDHDCSVGDFSHIAPGASLAGNVKLGHKVLIGAGARILPGVKIGNAATIGAGAVVISDVPSGVIVKGVPARCTR